MSKNSRVKVIKQDISKADFVTTIKDNSDLQILEDGIIIPPFDGISLYRLRDGSSPLSVCLVTIARIVTDYGYRIIKKKYKEEDTQKSEILEEKLKALEEEIKDKSNNIGFIDNLVEIKNNLIENIKNEKEKEKKEKEEENKLKEVENIFETVHPTKSINQILKESILNGLLYGYSGIEVIFNSTETDFMLENIPTHELNLTTIDNEFTDYEYIDSEGTKKSWKWKFRRYAQRQKSTGKTTYYKELLDRRHLNFQDGKFYESLPDNLEANPCIFFNFGLPNDNDYPSPIWLGEINNILGYEHATRLNNEWFDDGMMVPMLIVFNGMLDEDTYEELKAMLRDSKGISGRTKAIVIENQTIDNSFTEEVKQRFDMKVERLPAMDMNDGQFLKYIDKVIDNTRMIFNLPAILLGMEKSYNRATASTAFEMAEAQVFQPYRKVLEQGINNLLKRMGIYEYEFKLNSPTITDYTKWSELLKPFMDMDILPVGELVEIYNEIFNKDLSIKENSDLIVSEWKKRYINNKDLEENKYNTSELMTDINEVSTNSDNDINDTIQNSLKSILVKEK